MGERLLLARSFEEPMMFDLESIDQCLRTIPVTNITKSEIDGALLTCDYHFRNDIAHLTIDSQLLFLSTEAREAGYDLAFKVAKCLPCEVFVVRGDSTETKVAIDDCSSTDELREKLVAK